MAGRPKGDWPEVLEFLETRGWRVLNRVQHGQGLKFRTPAGTTVSLAKSELTWAHAPHLLLYHELELHRAVLDAIETAFWTWKDNLK